MKKIRLWLLKTDTKPSKKSNDNEKKKEKNIVMPISPANQLTLDIFFFLPTHLARVLIYMNGILIRQKKHE